MNQRLSSSSDTNNGLPPNILIIDDEEAICTSLQGLFSDEGWESQYELSGEAAMGRLDLHQFDVLLLDIWLPGMNGIDVLQKFRIQQPGTQVIIMSGHATIETAVKATRLGAADFLEKPISVDKLFNVINSLKVKKSKNKRNVYSQAVDSEIIQIVGKSTEIECVKSQIKMVAPRNSSVLITGENGTGKELVAKLIHARSKREHKPFVAVNCAAIPEELIESELFGYNKGAFTGATHLNKGRFEAANGGTLFLDEVADMSLKTQAKVLRVLQEGVIERLGSSSPIKIDVRIVAATNKNLQECIEQGAFRQDLYYRLNVIPINVPSLHERSKDIGSLSHHFLNQIASDMDEPPKRLGSGVLEVLESYNWPGNVRQLRNLIERVVILSKGPIVELNDIPDEYFSCDDSQHSGSLSDDIETSLKSGTLKEAKSCLERKMISERLAYTDGNVKKAAESLGIERSYLHKKMRTYELSKK